MLFISTELKINKKEKKYGCVPVVTNRTSKRDGTPNTETPKHGGVPSQRSARAQRHSKLYDTWSALALQAHLNHKHDVTPNATFIPTKTRRTRKHSKHDDFHISMTLKTQRNFKCDNTVKRDDNRTEKKIQKWNCSTEINLCGAFCYWFTFLNH